MKAHPACRRISELSQGPPGPGAWAPEHTHIKGPLTELLCSRRLRTDWRNANGRRGGKMEVGSCSPRGVAPRRRNHHAPAPGSAPGTAGVSTVGWQLLLHYGSKGLRPGGERCNSCWPPFRVESVRGQIGQGRFCCRQEMMADAVWHGGVSRKGVS
ncbi:unnamed protein product [Boreogadus saida]